HGGGTATRVASALARRRRAADLHRAIAGTRRPTRRVATGPMTDRASETTLGSGARRMACQYALVASTASIARCVALLSILAGAASASAQQARDPLAA